MAAAAPGGGVFEIVIRVTVLTLQGGVYPVGWNRGGLVIIALTLVLRGGNGEDPRHE